jgi:NADH:ubiquinone reductase (H+-translocating)
MKVETIETRTTTAPMEPNPDLRDISTGFVDYGAISESRQGRETSLHRVLIVGGGAGGLELATQLGDSLGRRGKASIALLDKTRVHVWKPHLHEIASGTLDIDVDSVEYLAHARAHHYRFRIGAMCGLDRQKRQVFVQPTFDEDGRQLIPPRVLGYDTLILAVGSVGNDFATPGVKEYAIAIDSAEEAARFNRRMINACVRANAQHEPLHEAQLHCVVIGAGATGVELTAELHKTMRDIAAYGLDSIDFDKLIKLTIIEAGPRILGPLPEQLAASTLDMLNRLGVQVLTGKQAAEITKEGVKLSSGEFIQAEMVVWAAGIKAPDFLKDIDGLESDRINRLVVRDTLQTTRDDNIFAIGDCACYLLPQDGMPTPPRAQTAHQMASLVQKAVSARLKNKALPKFKYRDFGNLVNLSEYGTVGNLVGLVGKRSVYLEGVFARLMYRSLYKMHQRALHGTLKTALDTAASLISRRTEPRVKLH